MTRSFMLSLRRIRNFLLMGIGMTGLFAISLVTGTPASAAVSAASGSPGTCKSGKAVFVSSPILHPSHGTPQCPTAAIGHLPGSSSPKSRSVSTGTSVAPAAVNNGTAWCQYYNHFLFLPATSAQVCLQGTGTWTPSQLGTGKLESLINSTPYRVWLHQNPDGSGWADCFTPHSLWMVSGTRDASPGNIQISSNTSSCSTYANQAGLDCYNGTFAWTTYGNYSYGDCWSGPSVTYTDPSNGRNIYFLTNGTPYRVWLHGSGYADCYDQGNVYWIYGTRDSDPGNLQVSANTSYC